MKQPLSRMLQIFSGRDQSEKTSPIQDRYCVCGALKREVAGREGEPSSKIQADLTEH